MRTPALLAATLIVLALAGCQTDDPVVVPQPEPTSTPLFASEEEALAAAEEAFAAYLAVLDNVSADGGLAVDRLAEVATADVVEHESQGMNEMAAAGEHTVGSRSFDSMTVQSLDLTATQAVVVVYACQDFSGIDVVDSAGASVVSPSRRLRYPLEVTFDKGSRAGLIVAGVDDWTGSDFCAS